MHLAQLSVWLACAKSLAVLKIEKDADGSGKVIEPKIRYVELAERSGISFRPELLLRWPAFDGFALRLVTFFRSSAPSRHGGIRARNRFASVESCFVVSCSPVVALRRLIFF